MNTKSFPKLRTLPYNQEILKVVSSGGAPTPAGTPVFTKHNWDMGMGIYGLMGGAFMVGHFDLMSGVMIT